MCTLNQSDSFQSDILDLIQRLQTKLIPERLYLASVAGGCQGMFRELLEA